METNRIARLLLAGGLLIFAMPHVGISQESAANDASEAPSSPNGSFVVFDPPGAVCPNAYTSICAEAVGIDSSGDIAGYYVDAASIEHGYFRLGNGKIYGFDAPGATCFGAPGCTAVNGMSPKGYILGSYYNGTIRVGFVRDTKGNFTNLEIPGANDIEPTAMNASGDIAGYYSGVDGTLAFVRDAKGNYTSFDVSGTGQGTYPSAINSHGEIVGTYAVSGWDIQAFLRCVDGTVTLLTFPDASSAYYFTPPSIDDVGQIVGSYDAGGNGDQDGFFRNTRGGYTGFSYPGASATVPAAIDASGILAGSYSLGANYFRGFYRLPDGYFGSFGPAGQVSTVPTAINSLGAITGNYVDENNLTHAFVWKSH